MNWSHDFFITIRLDSLFVAVLALSKLLKTVKAAAKCLNASVSGPPPATLNNCLNIIIDKYVLPLPLAPLKMSNQIHYFTIRKSFISHLKIIAWGYPVSFCCLTDSCTILNNFSLFKASWQVLFRVNAFLPSFNELIDSNTGPTLVCKKFVIDIKTI